MISNDEIIELEYLLKKQEQCDARKDILAFTIYTKPNFIPYWFHKSYYKKLQEFAEGKINKLMVFIPPQHGKSEGSTRRLPAYLLGLNPELKIAIVSYSADKSRKFNREIQRIIDDQKYYDLFDTKLSDGSDGYIRTTDECETVGFEGSYKTIGVGGPLTGDPVDVLIMDDLYKGPKEAWSPVNQQNVIDWYDTVGESRLHNGSRQLIVFTRWDENDLAGHILKEQPGEWEVVKFPAIKVGEPNEIDPRKEGEALWPERHSLEKLQKTRQRNSHVFDSLYQQDPSPKEGLMYQEFKTYSQIPEFKIIKNYTDTADTGDDYLCSIVYGVPKDNGAYRYVLDILYTQEPMEKTEPWTASMLARNNVNDADIESNNGGRGFARNVQSKLDAGNAKTKVNWFHQSENKDSRIYSNSAYVNANLIFPDDWKQRWPKFYLSLRGYKKSGKNKNDDAADTITGIFEKSMKINNNEYWSL